MVRNKLSKQPVQAGAANKFKTTQTHTKKQPELFRSKIAVILSALLTSTSSLSLTHSFQYLKVQRQNIAKRFKESRTSHWCCTYKVSLCTRKCFLAIHLSGWGFSVYKHGWPEYFNLRLRVALKFGCISIVNKKNMRNIFGLKEV